MTNGGSSRILTFGGSVLTLLGSKHDRRKLGYEVASNPG